MAIVHRDPLEELTHWEPFRGIERLQQEMNRVFDRFMPSSTGEIRSLSFFPSAEIEKTELNQCAERSIAAEFSQLYSHSTRASFEVGDRYNPGIYR